MSTNTPKRNNRRATIFVTGPHSKRTIYEEDEEQEKMVSLQDIELARQRLQKDMVVMNTANSIEILVQIVMDECEIIRHNLRESGIKMRTFFRKNYDLFHQWIFKFFVKNRRLLEYKRDEEMILNTLEKSSVERYSWKPPRYTLNDVEEVMTTDDLEDGIIQRRTPKWESLPVRVRNEPIEDDSFCEFRKLNQPMNMILEDEDEDRLSMPSTRTVQTQEDQMQAIQMQLAMLSKQLMTLQKTNAVSHVSSRASSRKGTRRIEKKSSIDITSSPSSSSSSVSSDISEDEGKGPSLYSPTTAKKVETLPPIVVAPIAPPPPPPPTTTILRFGAPSKAEITPITPNKKSPMKENVDNNSDRPYLMQIANGRSLLKKTARSPGGSPLNAIHQSRRHLSTFEAALRDRFRGFHGEGSFSEQEDDANATWDEE
ncbi:unnamed protein product [Caenorhabditis angaria]|uniref:Uncharacterized protein n=1 Tax=Caenorhabditis angaria TaxID=860376 RepID=A0A9P1IM66_9PELO|nr:unnamed protein product [Caenorhabditis angaria]